MKPAEPQALVPVYLESLPLWAALPHGDPSRPPNPIVQATNLAAPLVLHEDEFDQRLRSHLTLLKITRRHFSPLFEYAPSADYAILVTDETGCLLDVSGPSSILTELDKHGISVGTDFSERTMGPNAMAHALVQGQPSSMVSTDKTALCPFAITAAPLLAGRNSHVVGAVGFLTLSQNTAETLLPLTAHAATAIAHSLQAEEAYQDLARIHQSLLGHLECHVIVVNHLQQVIEERHPIPVDDEVRTQMIQLTMNGEYCESEFALADRVYCTDVRKLMDSVGRSKGKLAIFRDITRSRRMEQKMQDAEKMSVLAGLAAGIAHEIRNPLTTAKGFLQLFQERQPNADDQRFLTLTLNELDRIQRLVTDFMSLAKPDVTRCDYLCLHQLLQEVVDFLVPEASLKNVELVTDWSEETAIIWGDANQLKQVALNVLQNALQATSSKCEVIIRLRRTTHQVFDNAVSHVMLTITDSGCGMTKDQLARVFQPYYTTKSTGTGLGLAISKRIVEEHGGFINIESHPGKGTSVSISLPLTKPTA